MEKITTTINLKHTLDSGQIFRYRRENEGWRVIHGKYSFIVAWRKGSIESRGIPNAKLSAFFRLNDDYERIIKTINKDSIIADAIKKYPGLRILRQDPWECTISFLCSSATNIPRIKRDLNSIAQAFGEEKEGIFLFPKIGEIDDEKKLRECGTGFRAKYIAEVNSTVTSTFFKKLKTKPYQEAKARLMELPGIGPKVADCILLFSCDHLNAFPIDTWGEKILKEDYNQHPKANYAKLSAFAQSYFSPYAGYAQQFLYHWKRMGR